MSDLEEEFLLSMNDIAKRLKLWSDDQTTVLSASLRVSRVFAHSDISEIFYPWVRKFSPRISEISETNFPFPPDLGNLISEIFEILDRKICENHGFQK